MGLARGGSLEAPVRVGLTSSSLSLLALLTVRTPRELGSNPQGFRDCSTKEALGPFQGMLLQGLPRAELSPCQAPTFGIHSSDDATLCHSQREQTSKALSHNAGVVRGFKTRNIPVLSGQDRQA